MKTHHSSFERNKMKLTVFDIETAGIRDIALELAEPFKNFEPLPPFDPKAVKVGNIKDPDKIAAKIRAEEEAYPDKVKEHEAEYERKKDEYEAKIVSNAALNAITGRIVAIGIKQYDKEFILSGDEISVLKAFWDLFATSNDFFVGWNSNDFDVPFLVQRSWKLGVIVPNIFNGRYLDKRFIDLMEMFACGKYGYRLSLDKASKYFGIQGKFDGDCTGETFAQMWESDDPVAHQTAEQYLKCDLHATWGIAEKMLPCVPKIDADFC